MVAFFPNICSPAFGWQLEDNLINELHHNELFADYSPTKQDASNNSITSSPHPPEFDSHGSVPVKSQSDSMKRSIHNEYERDRRRKLNSLCSSLRNLLPEADQSKKSSIPCTIARVLKYIPEIQGNIERLTRKKEEILLRMSKQEHFSSFTNGQNVVAGPVISATCLNRREVMVQIGIKNRSEMIPLSKLLKILEGEGLQLMNASTLATYSDGIFYSLHLQAKAGIRIEDESYCAHLVSVLKKQARVSFSSCYT